MVAERAGTASATRRYGLSLDRVQSLRLPVTAGQASSGPGRGVAARDGHQRGGCGGTSERGAGTGGTPGDPGGGGGLRGGADGPDGGRGRAARGAPRGGG